MALCFASTFTGLSVRTSTGVSTSTLRPSRTPVVRRAAAPHSTRMVAAPSRPQPASPSPAAPVERMSVLLPEKLSAAGLDLLSENYDVEQNFDLSPEQLVEEIKHHDAIIVRSATRVTREVIEASPRLRVIGRAGVGVDNIDLTAATEKGVLVVNAPTGNCVAAAEHTISLMCSVARKVSVADATMKSGDWARGSFVGVSLVGKTLGVVGLGRIGREVAMRAKGLGMNILASDPLTSPEAAAAIGVKLAPFSDVVAGCDFLTLHLPLIDSTKNLVDAKAFEKMKDGVHIINAARGGIVVEEALLAAIESGKVAGAALDCFENEPPYKYPDSISAKLVARKEVLATPHLGASTREAQLDVAVEIASAVSNALNGDMVPTMVNAPVMSPETLKEMKPRAVLAERLGKLAYYLSGSRMHGEVEVTYHLPDASEDTRLLRCGVLRGMLEAGLGLNITIVNADGMAKAHGLNVTEVSHSMTDANSHEEVRVAIKGGPVVCGRVAHGIPHVTGVGSWELDLALTGTVMVYSQVDRPGMMGAVGSLLGSHGINISSMTLARDRFFVDGAKALVLLGVDDTPSDTLIAEVAEIVNDDYLQPTVLNFS